MAGGETPCIVLDGVPPSTGPDRYWTLGCRSPPSLPLRDTPVPVPPGSLCRLRESVSTEGGRFVWVSECRVKEDKVSFHVEVFTST